ncbi:MAG: dGTP triphosphohydrolase [Candidatus Wallbacteria bacterium HGW-Wallbacteria-1]|uniref:dGTP triphosphohydrolase n=1 Tax=Candidatus Wallbacteria bacterium HGW-Wallbacteria-1 TaxID=2013854 RepID=A0A2N1PPJ0_9BACT|nr:MAG: dGTP triphosphohydrolase [Candidatus Wallbacteria bacterium HGW-Wallbacteria-1]
MNSSPVLNRSKLLEIREEILLREDSQLSKMASKSADGFRLREHDLVEDLRTPYVIDRDKIIYSGAYRRYQGKTQVVYFPAKVSEVVSNRSLHTFYVTNIAMTVGKYLGLNLELLQAIALGHDLGHAPFGHDGETMLSALWEKSENREFHHNIQSYYIVDHVAYKGRGLNLTLQTKDGIICHDGEVRNTRLRPPREVSARERIQELNRYIAEKEAGKKPVIVPWTMEGCVVRITDVIAYIGQDIEDAIRFGLITRDQVPPVLGKTNGEIIDNLLSDLISESYGQDWLGLSAEMSTRLEELKAWNYANIYKNPGLNKHRDKISRCFQILFDRYCNDIECKSKSSQVWKDFLSDKAEEYMESYSTVEKVKDFIAGMSDSYFVKCIEEYIVP